MDLQRRTTFRLLRCKFLCCQDPGQPLFIQHGQILPDLLEIDHVAEIHHAPARTPSIQPCFATTLELGQQLLVAEAVDGRDCRHVRGELNAAIVELLEQPLAWVGVERLVCLASDHVGLDHEVTAKHLDEVGLGLHHPMQVVVAGTDLHLAAYPIALMHQLDHQLARTTVVAPLLAAQHPAGIVSMAIKPEGRRVDPKARDLGEIADVSMRNMTLAIEPNTCAFPLLLGIHLGGNLPVGFLRVVGRCRWHPPLGLKRVRIDDRYPVIGRNTSPAFKNMHRLAICCVVSHHPDGYSVAGPAWDPALGRPTNR